MRGMRTAGQDFSTDFGELKASGTELPLARMQTSSLDKAATYFDIYDLRVTCETRAGISDVNYSAIINLLHDAGVRYKEERRYNVQPDRVVMEILIQKEDIEAINDLNKESEKQGYTFTFNDNLPEDIQDRIITTPEKELEVKVTEDTVKSAGKKTADISQKGWFSFSEGVEGYQYVVIDNILYSAKEVGEGKNPGDAFAVTQDSFMGDDEFNEFADALQSETGYDLKQSPAITIDASKKTAGVLDELLEGAEELLAYGNSGEKARGAGMQSAINAIKSGEDTSELKAEAEDALGGGDSSEKARAGGILEVLEEAGTTASKKTAQFGTYHFTVTLAGSGESAEEAWNDAVISLGMEPGAPPEGNDTKLIKSSKKVVSKFGTYEFTITMSGSGDNVDEAWGDAVDALLIDPGTPPEGGDTQFIEEASKKTAGFDRDKFAPDTKYVDIVFLDGNNAEEALTILETDGEEGLGNHLAEWDYGEYDGQESSDKPWGDADTTFEVAPYYVVSYNTGLGYVSMVMDLDKAAKTASKKTAGEEEEAVAESQVDYESEVLPILEEKLNDAFEEIASDYELLGSEDGGEEVEYKSRDGFMAFTNGGYSVTGITDVSFLVGSGKGLPTDSLQKEIDRVDTEGYENATEEFKKKYPEIVAELGEDNIYYNELYDKGYVNEAEWLSEAERSWSDISVLFKLSAYYYEPGNYHSDAPKSDSVYVKYAVNTDYEYHREKGDEIVADATISFDTPEELGQKLDAFLAGMNAPETAKTAE